MYKKLSFITKKVFFVLFIILLFSCSTHKNINYKSDVPENIGINYIYSRNNEVIVLNNEENIIKLHFLDYDAIEKSMERYKNNLLSLLEDNIIKIAKTYLGTPYLWGGTTRKGIDCSAFVQNVYKFNDISLPRTSNTQVNIGESILKEDLRKGDLIFFSKIPGGKITHVGIVENIDEFGEIYFIHSSSSKGVTISSLNLPYWNQRFKTAKRIINDELLSNIANIQSNIGNESLI